MTAATLSVASDREARDAIEARLRSLEGKDLLDQESAERAVGSLRRPEVIRERLGAPLRYSQRVEADVAGLAIDTLLPHSPDDHLGRFLQAWVPDELGHARSQEVLLRALELPTWEARPSDHIPMHNRVAGTLGRLSANAYDIVSMVFHTIGAMNERLAMDAYRRMATIAEELDEPELAGAILRPTYRDEAHHLGYYRTYARQLRSRLAPWQAAVARALVVHTYAPVGAGEAPDRAPFGEVVIALEDDPENPSVMVVVQDIAEELLARPGGELPPFVRKSVQRCVNLARQVRTHPGSA